jgi:hypothetical protein
MLGGSHCCVSYCHCRACLRSSWHTSSMAPLHGAAKESMRTLHANALLLCIMSSLGLHKPVRSYMQTLFGAVHHGAIVLQAL